MKAFLNTLKLALLILFMPVFAQTLFSFVLCYLRSFSLFSAWHNAHLHVFLFTILPFFLFGNCTISDPKNGIKYTNVWFNSYYQK